MGVSVQKALDRKTDDARKFMKFSQSLRNAGMFVVVVFGVVLPYFNTVATVLPIFFPRVAISFRPMFKERGVEYN